MGALRLLKVDYIRYRGDLKIDLSREKVEVGFKLKVRSHGLKYNCFMLSFTAGQLLGATARAYPLAATSSFLFYFIVGPNIIPGSGLIHNGSGLIIVWAPALRSNRSHTLLMP